MSEMKDGQEQGGKCRVRENQEEKESDAQRQDGEDDVKGLKVFIFWSYCIKYVQIWDLKANWCSLFFLQNFLLCKICNSM